MALDGLRRSPRFNHFIGTLFFWTIYGLLSRLCVCGTLYRTNDTIHEIQPRALIHSTASMSTSYDLDGGADVSDTGPPRNRDLEDGPKQEPSVSKFIHEYGRIVNGPEIEKAAKTYFSEFGGLPDDPLTREINTVKLNRVLRAYAFLPKEISFKRFTWLNLLNCVMYEDELMVLEAKYSQNPGLTFNQNDTKNMRELLKAYSKSIFNF